MRRFSGVLTTGLLLLAATVSAHHSFTAEFDGNQPITLTGAVTKVDWRNPHIWVYLDVKDGAGKVTSWQCEGGAPNALTRQGWSRATFTIGGDITVEGWRAKDGTNTCNAKTWKLGNGQTVLAGSSAGGDVSGAAGSNR